MSSNQKGFTIIEVISVILILSILVAMAIPKYNELIQQAKAASAKGEIAQMKSTLNLAYAKLLLSKAKAPTSAAEIIEVAFGTTMPVTIGAAPDDWKVSITESMNVANITVHQRGADMDYTATGTWNIPQ